MGEVLGASWVDGGSSAATLHLRFCIQCGNYSVYFTSRHATIKDELVFRNDSEPNWYRCGHHEEDGKYVVLNGWEPTATFVKPLNLDGAALNIVDGFTPLLGGGAC